MILRPRLLANLEESDFRVVGPSIVKGTEVAEWGIECVDMTRNIWGITFPPPLQGHQAGALLTGRACKREEIWPTSLLEVEVLERTGMIALECAACRKPAYWIYAQTVRRPSGFALADAVASLEHAWTSFHSRARKRRRSPSLTLPLCGKKIQLRPSKGSSLCVCIRYSSS